jgi:hypothetical protein
MSAVSKAEAYPIQAFAIAFLACPESREPLVWGVDHS